jgi:hypothetical protein
VRRTSDGASRSSLDADKSESHHNLMQHTEWQRNGKVNSTIGTIFLNGDRGFRIDLPN